MKSRLNVVALITAINLCTSALSVQATEVESDGVSPSAAAGTGNGASASLARLEEKESGLGISSVPPVVQDVQEGRLAGLGFSIPFSRAAWQETLMRRGVQLHDLLATVPCIGRVVERLDTLWAHRYTQSLVSNGISLVSNGIDAANFGWSCLRHPLRMGAAFFPLSQRAAALMASKIQCDEGQSVLELGPGTGVVTAAILEKFKTLENVGPERLTSVELGEEFIPRLQEKFPGVTFIQGDAQGLGTKICMDHKGHVSAVISTLPLKLMLPATRDLILKASRSMLTADGIFVQVTTYGRALPFDPADYGWRGQCLGSFLFPYPSHVWVCEPNKKEQ